VGLDVRPTVTGPQRIARVKKKNRFDGFGILFVVTVSGEMAVWPIRDSKARAIDRRLYWWVCVSVLYLPCLIGLSQSTISTARL
jgi:hypothetical protein